MKLATGQINGFLQQPPASCRLILLYGPDAGLVSERANNLARKLVPDPNDPFCSTLLTGSSANENQSRLADEMAAQAFGGGRRLIRLQHAIEANADSLKKLIAALPSGDSVMLVEAGDLDKRSKLRALFESTAPEVAAVPCYVEDTAQRLRTITEILQADGLSIARDVAALLADQLPPDRIAMRSEIDKLALYCRGQKDVTIEDIQATVTNAGAAEADELIFMVGSGETQKAETLMAHLFAEQVSPVAILRSAQRHFMKLQIARAMVEQGLSAREAVEKLQPKVFWKFVGPMTQQVQRWSPLRIERALTALYEAEAMVKKTGIPDTTLTAQLLLRLSV